MSTLIILGNVNRFTFANSIVAANHTSQQLFGQPLANIFVIHSRKSHVELQHNTDWGDHLERNEVKTTCVTERVIDVQDVGSFDDVADAIERQARKAAAQSRVMKQFVDDFVAYLEFILKGNEGNRQLMVDLTNGTTLYKNLLSTAAYILDIKHQFMIDTDTLFGLTKERGFLNIDILGQAYIPAPESIQLDNIAYLNLAEVVRYKRIIEHHTSRYGDIGKERSDPGFFQDNLRHSIQLKLQGDRTRDNAIYRIATSSIGASIEELVSFLYSLITDQDDASERKMLGDKLKDIRLKLESKPHPDFDLEFFRIFNDFVLYLRNSTVHKGRLLTDVQKFKADLSVKMSFPFIEFYTDIVYPLLSEEVVAEKPYKIKVINHRDTDEIFYFGLDGDNTGAILEDLFLAASDEKSFKRMSEAINKAIKEIRQTIEKDIPRSSIIFAAGDDILFKGYFCQAIIESIQQKYREITNGMTCSIGYGRSFREVYLALKLAKTEPGKNSIVGIELQ